MPTPTPAQVRARVAAMRLRHTLRAGEREMLAALTEAATARATMAAAHAAANEDGAAAAADRLKQAETVIAAWPRRRGIGEQELTAAREAALAGGTGFELLDRELPLVLLP